MVGLGGERRPARPAARPRSRRNLREIVRRSQAAGARVLLLGMRIPPNYGPYAGRFAALYPKLAKELNVPLVPFLLDKVGGDPLPEPGGRHPPHGQGAGDRGEERAALSGEGAGAAKASAVA